MALNGWNDDAGLHASSMMMHEDRQQCLQFFRGGRFAIVNGQQDIKPLARICLLNLQSNLLWKITIRDSVEFRRKNLYNPPSCPHSTPQGPRLDDHMTPGSEGEVTIVT